MQRLRFQDHPHTLGKNYRFEDEDDDEDEYEMDVQALWSSCDNWCSKNYLMTQNAGIPKESEKGPKGR